MDSLKVGETLSLDRLTSFTTDPGYAARYGAASTAKKYLLELRGKSKTISTDRISGLNHKEHITLGKFRVVSISPGKRVKMPDLFRGSTKFDVHIVIETGP